MMTKHRIKQYTKLVREISMLEDQIASAGNGSDYVTDYAKDYRMGYPRIITVSGFGTKNVPKLEARKARREAERDAIEDFIANVDDSRMWQILTRWGLENRSMEETAELVGCSREWVSKLINEFFK